MVRTGAGMRLSWCAVLVWHVPCQNFGISLRLWATALSLAVADAPSAPRSAPAKRFSRNEPGPPKVRRTSKRSWRSACRGTGDAHHATLRQSGESKSLLNLWPEVTHLKRRAGGHIVRLVERNSRKIISRLRAEGWKLLRVKGSHHQLGKNGLRITLVHPKRDVSPGVARAIAKVTGWMEEGDG